MAEMLIPITKAKRGMPIETDDYPMEVFREAVLLGFKELFNRGMSKIILKDLEGDKLEAAQNAAFVKAEENQVAAKAGEIRFSSGVSKKAAKVPTEIKNEALRLAKAAVTEQLKMDGHKVSHFAKTDIKKWAEEVLEADDSYFALAQAELERRKATPIKISLANLKPSEKLVKAAEEKKAKAKKDKTLSATQAGKTAPPATRQKPKPAAHMAH